MENTLKRPLVARNETYPALLRLVEDRSVRVVQCRVVRQLHGTVRHSYDDAQTRKYILALRLLRRRRQIAAAVHRGVVVGGDRAADLLEARRVDEGGDEVAEEAGEEQAAEDQAHVTEAHDAFHGKSFHGRRSFAASLILGPFDGRTIVCGSLNLTCACGVLRLAQAGSVSSSDDRYHVSVRRGSLMERLRTSDASPAPEKYVTCLYIVRISGDFISIKCNFTCSASTRTRKSLMCWLCGAETSLSCE